jgi:GT2 family glycosyltransferase
LFSGSFFVFLQTVKNAVCKVMDLSIVIVSWNARDYLRRCLFSIYSHKFSRTFETIVVDNCSADGSAEMVEAEFPQVVLIRAHDNLGFAKANNLGIRRSRSRYYALINSDVELLKDCLDEICRYMDQNPRVGLSGPRVLNSDLSIQASCRKFPSLWRNLCEATFLNYVFEKSAFFSGERMLYFAHDSIRRVEVLSGCFWVVRHEALQPVGLLDERFFIYAEDIDWCRRFRVFGWEVVFYPGATAIHHSGASSKNASARFSKEQLKARFQYWNKYYKLRRVLAFGIIILVHYGLRFIGEILISIIGRTSSQDKATERIGIRLYNLRTVWQILWNRAFLKSGV